MKIEQIQPSLDKMLTDPKAKGFLTHLIKAYMPLSNVTQVTEKPRGLFVCTLTKVPLVSQQELLESMQSDAFKNDFISFTKSMFDENSDRQSPMANIVGDRKLGVAGKDTTSFMSYAAFGEFTSWVFDKLATGEKHVTWLLKSMIKSMNKNQPQRAFASDYTRKRVPMEGVEIEGKAATFSIGEIPSLQALKEKLSLYEDSTSE